MNDTEDRAIAAIEAADRLIAQSLAKVVRSEPEWKAPSKTAKIAVGTHMGHLSAEARERRAKKNARAQARTWPHGGPPRPRGAARWKTRLHLVGNAAKRGSNYAHR